MRPITLISAVFISLQLLSGSARADSGGGAWAWPIRGPVLTEYRNGSDPYAAGQHRGIDIGAPVGARVVAATSGTVTFAGVAGSSGLTVAERTADGRLDLSYLHLASASVHRGETVAAGTQLGTVGTSGRRSAEAPHLHFGVRDAGSRTAYRNPLDFLPTPPAERTPTPQPTPVPVAVPAEPHPSPGTVATQGSPAVAPHGAPAVAPHGSPASASTGPPAPAVSTPAHLFPGPGGTNHGPSPSNRPGPRAAMPALEPTGRHHGFAAATPGSPLMAPHGPTARPRPPAGSATHTHESGARHGHEFNVGWLLACLGLVAAATALGHPDATRRLTRRGGAHLTALRHSRVGALRRTRLGAVLRPAPRDR